MPSLLQIPNPRERLAVRVADAITAPLGWLRPSPPAQVRRILLLRLERIGDLLMTVDAIADVRRAWPDAQVELATGSWNAPLAALLPGIAHVHLADVPWLSRGERPASWRTLVRDARDWRRRGFDLAINFEPDIRSNFLLWLSGATDRVGYPSGGGGSFLTRAGRYDPSRHVAENARALVAVASRRPQGDGRRHPAIDVPAADVTIAAARLQGAARPLVGFHVSGGRESKQWHLDRFADAARRIAAASSGTIVLTGGPTDDALVAHVKGRLDGVPVIDTAGALDLPGTAALLGRLDLLVTGDTGPMHLAAAVGTPVVALFGPSDPRRYGPNATRERILRVELPCSPCGLVRLPPERCRGHVPDCMDGITVEAVVAAALDLLRTAAPLAAAGESGA